MYPSKEALLHDVRVQTQQIQFLLQWNGTRLSGAKTRSQEIAEPRQDTISAHNVDLHERGDRVECIEQEMRPELRLKLGELRLHQSLLHLAKLRALFA